MYTILLAVLLCLQCFSLPTDCLPASSFPDPIVTTKLGELRGHVKTLDDGTPVNVFDGVPYAKPPIGDLRFKKPVAYDTHWKQPYNATKYKYACMQNIGMKPVDLSPIELGPVEAPPNEDCLYLVVHQPMSAFKNPKEKKAVMFWIHGGGFMEGTAMSVVYDARYIAALGDVIVVTINYRLGVWGFFYGDSKEYPGNLALHDQLMALKWTRENIESFGGDPNKITVLGESAGSMSTGAMILSPLSRGLFARAIMQSGAPNSYMGGQPKEEMLKNTIDLAKAVGCNQTSFEDKIKCAVKADNKEILKFMENSVLNGNLFAPMYGDEYLPEKPSEALKNGHFNKEIDLIFGTVRDEGSLFVTSLFGKEFEPPHPKTFTKSKTKGYIFAIFTIMKKTFAKAVSEFYTDDLVDDGKDTDKYTTAVGRAFGDFHLTCPVVLFGTAFSNWNKNHKAYAFRLSHDLTESLHAWPLCRGWMGICHGDDVVLLFGFPIRLRGVGYSEKDYKASRDMIRAWSHFAKTGKALSLEGTSWPESIDRDDTNSSVKFLDLNPHNYTVVNNFYRKNCDTFWKPYLG